jgi:hypothetical protein
MDGEGRPQRPQVVERCSPKIGEWAGGKAFGFDFPGGRSFAIVRRGGGFDFSSSQGHRRYIIFHIRIYSSALRNHARPVDESDLR